MRPSFLSRVALVLLLVVPLALSGTSSARAEVGDLTSRVLTPLASGNDAITSVGVQRGRGMERESLGLAVSAGSVIEARVTNSVGDVRLSLMTDNHETDVEFGNGYQPGDTRLPTNGTWQRITAVAASGVFVRSRPWTTAPRIEYRVASGAAYEMPAYRLGDSQDTFATSWQSSGSPFAVLVDGAFTMLLPRVDLPEVRDMGWSQFDDLDAVILFYRKLMSTYDSWLGVSDADPNPLHRNLAQAPFMRPDRTGWGLAYYAGGNYIGTNIGSVHYYLEGPASWLILHEIGHGYDGIMTSTAGPDDIQLGEVWNNVYGYQYQTLINGIAGPNWLNGTSKTVDQKRRDDTRRAAGGSVKFNNLDYQEKLDFVARIADLTGPTGFAAFNRSLRELRASDDFSAWPSRKDLIAQRWGGAQSHNLAPWFEVHSLPVSPGVAEDLYDIQQLPIAMPLGDMFTDAGRAQSAATHLGLDSTGALVSSIRTATLETTGSVRVAAATTSPGDIEGRLVSLWRGNTEVAAAPFVAGVADFADIPLGALTVRFPLSTTTGVVPPRQWVAVRQSSGASLVSVAYPETAPPLALDATRLTLLGLGDSAFSSVEHDPVNATLTVSDTLESPHSYFPDQYARITISADGQQIFDRSFIGDKKRNAAPSMTVPATTGSTITITHREPSRIVETIPSTGAAKPSLNATEPTTTWRVTGNGLVKISDDGTWDEQEAARDSRVALETALNQLERTVTHNPTAQLSVAAAQLRIAVDRLLDPAERQRLESRFGSVLNQQIALADRFVPVVTPSPSPSVSATTSPTVTASPTGSPTATTSPTTSPTASPTATTSSPTTVPTTTQPSVVPTKTMRPTVAATPTRTTAPTKPATTPAPFDLYSTPGHHIVNGRQWFTTCEAYSQTQRCRTQIWGTTVTYAQGRFVQRTGWQFNNLTYLPSPRSLWTGNRLGHTNAWTATDGRKWRTECDTAATGRNGCRSWTTSRVVQARPTPGGGFTYAIENVEVFNNIVRFS